VALFGPTGSGKTDIAVHVARLLGTEVVNCDPAQCYAGLPILTNQPSSEHDAVAPHRLISCWPLTHDATVAEFVRHAHAEIDELVARTGHAVLCGGSGLYMLSALAQLAFASRAHGAAPADPELRDQLHHEADELGEQHLHARLRALDAAAAQRIHPNDRKRVIRAIEAALAGGSVAGGSIWDVPHRLGSVVIGLHVARPVLHARIETRTSGMFTRGLLDEVAAIVGSDGAGLGVISPTARRIHGLSDCARILAGDVSRARGEELQLFRTRQYAKRQDTWARRWPGLRVLEPPPHAPPAEVATLAAALASRAALDVEGTTCDSPSGRERATTTS
jgi:tRNA dimethylallyltransferase